MIFTKTAYDSRKNILANEHYVGIPYNFSALTALAVDGVIRAGTVVPANDATAKGVALQCDSRAEGGHLGLDVDQVDRHAGFGEQNGRGGSGRA